MKDQEIDAILSNEAAIAPSSGFVGSVMDSVRSKAAMPPPFPFPWQRALPGIVVCGIALVWLVMQALRSSVEIESSRPVFSALTTHVSPWLIAFEMAGGVWILLAILLTLAGITLTMRLASGR